MTRKAFIWGSNGPDVPEKLKYASDDAKRMAETLVGPPYNFAVTFPTVTDDPYQIKKELDLLAKSCRIEDSFVIYFSGHGDLLGGELMLVLDGTVFGDVTTYLPANWVRESRGRSCATNRLIILDCCHAGGAAGAKDTIGFQAVFDSKTELMLLASGRRETAREFDHLRGSFLTTEMCDFLRKTTNTSVGLHQLMDHLNQSARGHNDLVDKGVLSHLPKVPIPFLNGEHQGEFYFTRPPSSWIRHQIQGPCETELLVIPAYSGDRAWCIRRTPVTNKQYRRFVEEAPDILIDYQVKKIPSGDIFCSLRGRRDWVEGLSLGDGVDGWVGPFEPWNHEEFAADDQPVVCVSFLEAATYAMWLTSGGWLQFFVTPQVVWDIAAFGQKFPVHNREAWQQKEIHHKATTTASVSYADGRTTPYGAVDMIGNVWEWCSEEEEADFERPGSISIATERTRGVALEIRGGSYLDDLSRNVPFCPVSSIPDRDICRHSDLGFRVACTLPLEDLPPEVAEHVLTGFNLTPEPDRDKARIRIKLRK
jgi:formylglycine-generating enzyme required for sulfatase activity